MEEELPLVVYVGLINFAGLYSSDPISCMLDDKGWTSRLEDITIYKLGHTYNIGSIIYANEDKENVEIWIQGAQAVLKQLQNFSKLNTGCSRCTSDKELDSKLCVFCESNDKENSKHCPNCGTQMIYSEKRFSCQNCRHIELVG